MGFPWSLISTSLYALPSESYHPENVMPDLVAVGIWLARTALFFLMLSDVTEQLPPAASNVIVK